MFFNRLSGLNGNKRDIDYLTATVSFKYKLYEFSLKGVLGQ